MLYRAALIEPAGLSIKNYGDRSNVAARDLRPQNFSRLKFHFAKTPMMRIKLFASLDKKAPRFANVAREHAVRDV